MRHLRLTDQYSKGLENGGFYALLAEPFGSFKRLKIDSSPPAYYSAAADALEPLKPLNISSYLACPCSAENRSGYTRFTQISFASYVGVIAIAIKARPEVWRVRMPRRLAFLGPSARIKTSLFNLLERRRSHLSEVCNLRQSAALRQRGQPREQHPPPPLESQPQAGPRRRRWSSQADSCLHRLHSFGSREKSCLSQKL